MIKSLVTLLLTITSSCLFGQNGYIKLIKNDAVLTGYLKYFTSVREGQPGIELWKTKKDREPLKILKMEIDEYAIENDTFKILQQYEPFENIRIYFEIVDAKLKSRGKVNLYVIQNYNKWNAYLNSVSTYTGGGLIPAIIDASLNKHSHQEVLENYSYLYVLEESETGYIQALSSKNESLMETLLFFFSETYVSKYREVKGEITYKSIPALVELYNSK